MPIVPVAERQVGEAGLPQVRVQGSAPIEAFGGGQGMANAAQATNRLLDVGTEIALKEKQRADDTRVKEAYASLVKAEQDMLLNPKSGAYTRKGKDAFGVPDEFGEQFDKTADDISAGLADEDQRAMFNQIRMQRRTQFDGDLKQHLAKEAQVYEKQVTDSALSAAMDEAVVNYKNPERVAQSLKDQEALVRDYWGKQGAANEVIEQKVREQASVAHASIIERFINNDEDMAAAEYFKANKDFITDGETRVRIEKALEDGSLRGESQRQSDAIMSQGLSMTKALEEVKKIEDPKLRDLVQDRLRGDYALKEAARRDALEKSHINSLNILDQSGGDIDQVMRRPEWRGFSQSERTGLMAYARSKKEGRDIDTDFSLYYGLRQMAVDDPNDFKSVNLADPKYLNSLNKTDRETMVDLQMKMRNGDGAIKSTLDGFRSDDSIVNDALKSMDINPNAKAGSRDAERAALFRRKVDEEIQRRQEATGKKATNKDTQEIADMFSIEGITKKNTFWFDEKKRFFEVTPDNSEFEIKSDTIPQSDRAKIEDALRRRNMPITEENILKLYGTKLRKLKSNG
jgi:hypothetical protein